MMSIIKGYSIWLMPEQKLFIKLKPLISELQKLVNQPEFDPHITLISGFELREPEILHRSKVLAKSNESLTLVLSKPMWGYTFFQRYYYEIKPSDSLTELYNKSLFMFGKSEIHGYHPHLSLQYADHTQPPDSSLVDHIHSFCYQPFKIDRLQVMLTKGEISDWKEVASYDFGTS